MPRVVDSAEFWFVQRLPEVPEYAAPPAGFTKSQGDDFTLSLDIMRMLHKPSDGTRRTVYGLNRAAQKRWPDRGIWIGNTESIVQAWAIAGWVAIAKLVMKPKFDLHGRPTFGRVYHDLKSLAIVITPSLDDNEEVFLTGALAYELGRDLEASWKYYRVAAETNWGTYKFAIAHHCVPEWRDVEYYCRWHTMHVPTG